MNAKQLLLLVLVCAVSNIWPISAQKMENKNVQKAIYPYLDDTRSADERVEDLLSRMTLEEKVAQMQSYSASVFIINGQLDVNKLDELLKNGIGQLRDLSWMDLEVSVELHNQLQKFLVENTRLGIPAIIHGEGLHGFVGNDATSFPAAIAMAGTWNLELIDEVYSIIAKETRSRGVQQLLTPVLDIARDPRWGRFSETFGEDPFLTAEIGKQVVSSFQGTGDSYLDNQHVISTLKHFPAHGSGYGGMNCAPALTNERLMRDVHMYPFTKCIQQAGAASIMAMYGEIDGVPVHSSQYLLKDVLRDELGFKGYVVSDYAALELLATGPQWEFNRHHVAEDSIAAGKLALEAGVNIELLKPYGYAALVELLKNGMVKESQIDELLRPMLMAKINLGLFDNPYVPVEKAIEVTMSSENDSLALQAAKESVIMLKNKNSIAPLNINNLKTIAVIGPNADRQLLGDYSTQNPRYFSTVRDGITKRVGKNTRVLYHEGCKITHEIPENKELLETDRESIAQAVQLAKEAEVVVVVVGGDKTTAMEGRDRSALDLVGLQEELVLQLKALGKPVILCIIGGMPYAIPQVYEAVDVIYQCWNLGQETGNGLAAVLFGDHNPSAKLTVSIPRSVGNLPVFYNKKPSAYMREYIYDKGPGGFCFPFGFGMSYTEYEYGNLHLVNDSLNDGEDLQFQIDVTNTGQRTGTEIVQVYIHDWVSSVTRPMKELKGFERVTLSPGETKTVRFTLSFDNLAFHNRDMQRVVEPGMFELMVGASSRDEDLSTANFFVKQ